MIDSPQHRARLALLAKHAETLTGCPCLMSWAVEVRVQHVAGQRTVTWQCPRCGGYNSETDSVDGGPLARGSAGDVSMPHHRRIL